MKYLAKKIVMDGEGATKFIEIAVSGASDDLQAKKSALSISSARYSPPAREGKYLIRHDISFPVEGPYKNIRKFIYKLEKMPYLMTIDDLALTSKEKQTVSVTIRISLYLRAEADE